MPRYDTGVLGGTVVFPYLGAVRCDVGIRDGRIAAPSPIRSPPATRPSSSTRAIDSCCRERDRLGARRRRDHGRVSYFRTGQNYLNKSGPYRTIFPEVVAATTGHAFTDFGYHIGVMTSEQLDEVDWLVAEQGVGSFKHYMFYKGLNLTSDSTRGSAYTMADTYDLGHLYLLMRQVAAAAGKHGGHERVVTPEVLCSTQDFTPFAGMRVRGWPTHTLLRGRIVFQEGAVRDQPGGRYIKRPVGLHEATAR
jgi:dihydropyrimidinase/allantoinase